MLRALAPALLIAGLGWMSGGALSRVDQDLRIMYTEYTLGAVDLAHISADVMRYRNTIIRALEAGSQKEFERITESLPGQRARVQLAVDRYAAAGPGGSRQIGMCRGRFRHSRVEILGERADPAGREARRRGDQAASRSPQRA